MRQVLSCPSLVGYGCLLEVVLPATRSASGSTGRRQERNSESASNLLSVSLYKPWIFYDCPVPVMEDSWGTRDAIRAWCVLSCLSAIAIPGPPWVHHRCKPLRELPWLASSVISISDSCLWDPHSASSSTSHPECQDSLSVVEIQYGSCCRCTDEEAVAGVMGWLHPPLLFCAT